MNSRIAIATGLAALALTVGTPSLGFAAPAGAATSGYFKTPFGNIVCVHSALGVLCGIKSGLKPAPLAEAHDGRATESLCA